MPSEQDKPLAQRIQELEANNETYIAFEFFPPRTEKGVENLYSRFSRMKAQSKVMLMD